MSNIKPTEQNLCLLALDGGGVRGLSSLYILKQLMHRINPESPPKPCEIFDLIGGTSTGGLIAIMLGRLKMDIDACIDAYTDMADSIFQKVAHRVTLSGKVQARFDSERLNEAIKAIIKEQGLQVDDVFIERPAQNCKVFVCATRGESRTLTRLSSYFTERGANDGKITILEACRATSAASTFFDPTTIGRHGETYLDGATGANNPIRQLWSAARDLWPEGRLEDRLNCIVSVGTGRPSLTPFGNSIKDVAETLLAIATDTEENAESFARENPDLARSKKYFRLNVDRGLEGIGLERSDKAAAIVAATRTYLENQVTYESVLDCKNKLAARYALLNVSIRQSIPFEEDPDFVGRQDELAQIDKFFESHGRIALVGIGGVGKSQIAIKYLYQLKRQFPDTWIFWVFASTRGRFVQAYKKIAAQVDLPQKNDPDVNILQLVADWLNRPNQSTKWIMVLDNADDVNMFVEHNSDTSSTLGLHKASEDPLIMYLPDVDRGKVLITARDTGAAQNFTGSKENIIEVKPMSIPDGKYLMYKKLDIHHSSDPGVERLVCLLGALPLALTQAASYINSCGRRMTVDNYIALLTSTQLSSLKLLERESYDDRRDEFQSSSIIKTWQVSFDHIKQRNPAACDLLCFMAMLDGQAIPEFLLAYLVTDELDLGEQLSMLINFSFVGATENEAVFKIHFLVGLAAHRWIKSRNEYSRWNSQALIILSRNFPAKDGSTWIGKPVWEKRQIILPHVQKVLQYFSTEREDLLCRAMLLQNIAEDALDRGCFQQRVSEALESLELRQQLLGENDILTATSYATLGRVRLFEGDFETSNRLLEKAYHIAHDHNGIEDILTGDIAMYLSDLLIRLDRTVEAQNLVLRTMDTRKRVFGELHTATLEAINYLIILYRDTNQLDPAETLLASSISGHQKLYGQSHPATLATTLYLSTILLRARKLGEAEVYIDSVSKALEAQTVQCTVDAHIKLLALTSKALMGLIKLDKPMTLEVTKIVFEKLSVEFGMDSSIFFDFSSMTVIIWSAMDHLNDAKDLAKRLWNNLKENLGHDHPITIEAILRLASILASSKEMLQAEDLAQRALSLSRARQGVQHASTLQVEMLASEVFLGTGNYEAVAQLARHVYNTRRESLGGDHFRTVEALSRLAQSSFSLQRYTGATLLFSQVLESYQKIYGPNHFTTITAMENVVKAYVEQGRCVDCESDADTVVKFLETRLGAESRWTLEANHYRVVIKRELKKWDELKGIAVPLLEKQKKVFGQDDDRTLRTMSNLAVCNSYLGRYKEEEELTRCVVKHLEQTQGLENTWTISMKGELSKVLHRTGQFEEEEEVDQSIYYLKRKMLGPNHEETLQALEDLKSTRRRLAGETA